MLNTVRSNDNVGGFPHSYTFLAQLSEIIRALYSHLFPKKLEYGKFLQQALGTLFKFNKKTVTVVTESGQKWNISPHLLKKVKDVKSQSSGNVVGIHEKK